jgi:hypothetical protein
VNYEIRRNTRKDASGRQKVSGVTEGEQDSGILESLQCTDVGMPEDAIGGIRGEIRSVENRGYDMDVDKGIAEWEGGNPGDRVYGVTKRFPGRRKVIESTSDEIDHDGGVESAADLG